MKTMRLFGWTFATLAVSLLITGCESSRTVEARRARMGSTNGHLEDSMLVVDSSSGRALTVEEGNRIRADVRRFLESNGPLAPGTYTVRVNFKPDQPDLPGEFMVVQLTIFAPGPVTYELLASSAVPSTSYSIDYATDLYRFNDQYRGYYYGPGYGYPFDPSYYPSSPLTPGSLPGRSHRPDDDKDRDKDRDKNRPTPPGTVGRNDPDHRNDRPPTNRTPPSTTVARDDNRPDYNRRTRPTEPPRSNDSGSWGGRSSPPTQGSTAYNPPHDRSGSSGSGGGSYSPPPPPPSPPPRTESVAAAARDDQLRKEGAER